MTVSCDNYIEQNLLDTNLTFLRDTTVSSVCGSYLDYCEPIPLPQILDIGQSQSDDLGNGLSRRKKRSAPAFGPKNENDIIIPNDGVYLVILYIQTENKQETYNVSVEMEIKGEHGYLSANDWPFLEFYRIMSLLYLCYAIGWLIVSAMQWKDLLRIQFW